MRQRNWLAIIIGTVLIILAVVLFLGMAALVSQHVALPSDLEKTGAFAGAMAGVALVILVYGLIGKKV